MAHPSSSHRDRDDDRGTIRDRDRERERRSTAVHHHRTISSTTLLLVLSLILAVLAVMLSLPSRSSGVLPGSRQAAAAAAAAAHGDNLNDPEAGASHSFWGYLTPKRSHALVSRESNVALREAEVARREAEILTRPFPYPLECPPCVVDEVVDEGPSIALVSRPQVPVPPAPTTTVIKEIVKEIEPSDPGWLQTRLEGLVERETKISDREKEVGVREESVGRRESDATKREGWIMEQLNALAPPDPRNVVEEDYVYEDVPRHYYGEARRATPKELPAPTSTIIVTATETVTKAVLPPPAGTSLAAFPTPETFVQGASGITAGKTREVFIEKPTVVYEMPQETVIYDNRNPRKKWFGSRW